MCLYILFFRGLSGELYSGEIEICIRRVDGCLLGLCVEVMDVQCRFFLLMREKMNEGVDICLICCSQANQVDRLTGLVYPFSAVEVREAVSPETIVTAKGGINTLKDARHLARCGIDSVVLGRALMKVGSFY